MVVVDNRIVSNIKTSFLFPSHLVLESGGARGEIIFGSETVLPKMH